MLKRVIIACLFAAPVWAQQQPVPVREAVPADYEADRQRAQMRAGTAYRELREAQYRTRLAEQEVWAAEDAARASGADPAETGIRLSAAQKALAAAKSREAAARSAYDQTLTEVERIQRPGQSK